MHLGNCALNSRYKLFKVRKIPVVGNTRRVKIAAPLKYLINFWRTLEVPLISCKINLILTWSSTYFITDLNGEEELAIGDAKLYVSVVYHLKVMRLEREIEDIFL